MIAFLAGEVGGWRKDGAMVVKTASGVGYLVHVSKTYAEMSGSVELQIETRVREAETVLYGFVTNEERECFELLTSVQGVGGKVALSLLALGVHALYHAIVHDHKMLAKAEGVGAKLATRIGSELSGKVERLVPASASKLADAHARKTEVKSALVGLGYDKTLAATVAEWTSDPSQPVEKDIERALRALAAGKHGASE